MSVGEIELDFRNQILYTSEVHQQNQSQQTIIKHNRTLTDTTPSSIQISFQDLTYTIKSKKPLNPWSRELQKEIVVLDKISGIFPASQMSAILGGSGSGKTSLLNALAGRITQDKHHQLSGQMTMNTQSYDYDTFNQFAAYVMQNDILLETQTPYEAIKFVACLKFKDPQQIRERVGQTIRSLQLQNCKDTVIGGLLRKGISGGERKRTSIGVELVADPGCLILDEPTSGLDSYTAFHIIDQLKNLIIKFNKTIILTIHQPSSDLYGLFDNLFIMHQGKLVFQGTRMLAEEYYRDIQLPSPPNCNPLEHFISTAHDSNLSEHLTQSYGSLIQPHIQTNIQSQICSPFPEKQRSTSSLSKIRVLLKRNYQNYIRNPFLLAARLFLSIFLGISFGWIYWKVGENEGLPEQEYHLIGSVFFLTTTVLFCNALGILLVFDQERDVFVREEASKLYGLMEFFISKQFLELPDNIFLTFFQCTIAYWMMGYNDTQWWYFLQSVSIFCTLAMCGNSIGMMCGCLLKEKTFALSVTPLILMPYVMYGGYIANPRNYVTWMKWFQYLNPLKFAFEAEVTNETQQRVYLDEPLLHYDLKLGIWPCIGYIVVCFIVYRLLALLLLSRLRAKLQ